MEHLQFFNTYNTNKHNISLNESVTSDDTLRDICKDLGYSFSVYVAIHGSKYYRVDGIKFRISDHIQPSHYQTKNYFDVNSVDDIIRIINDPLFSYHSNPIIIDGDFFDMVYDETNDVFDKKQITKDEYDELLDMNNIKQSFLTDNGWLD